MRTRIRRRPGGGGAPLLLSSVVGVIFHKTNYQRRNALFFVRGALKKNKIVRLTVVPAISREN